MIKPDIIVSWPIHLDFPLWREFIHSNRFRFEKVIIVFTQMNTGKDYRSFLKEQFNKDRIISIDNDEVLGHQDWRNIAINKGLSFSDAKWVWFTEEDFFPNEGFWNAIELNSTLDVFGYFQEDRLHPCCIFIKRHLLNSTSRNFGVVKDLFDHFGVIQKELTDRKFPIGIIPRYLGHHFNGLSQNMYLLQIGQQPNYEPEKFKEYCKKCLEVKIEIQPEIKELLEKYIEEQKYYERFK